MHQDHKSQIFCYVIITSAKLLGGRVDPVISFQFGGKELALNKNSIWNICCWLNFSLVTSISLIRKWM